MLCISPFTFARRLNSLRHVSAFALSAVVYLLILVVYFFFFGTGDVFSTRPSWTDIRWIHMDSHFFSFLPIFVFAFTCHQNIFAVYNELIDNSPKEVEKVVRISIGSALGVYQTIGILGYLTFGTTVQSNIVAMCRDFPWIGTSCLVSYSL
jgi:amino acid permease